MIYKDFMECGICSVKPGTPSLCKACIHNRDSILRLQQKLRKAEARLPKLIHAEAEHGRFTLCDLDIDTLKDHTSGNVDNVTCPKCQEKLIHVTNDGALMMPLKREQILIELSNEERITRLEAQVAELSQDHDYRKED